MSFSIPIGFCNSWYSAAQCFGKTVLHSSLSLFQQGNRNQSLAARTTTPNWPQLDLPRNSCSSLWRYLICKWDVIPGLFWPLSAVWFASPHGFVPRCWHPTRVQRKVWRTRPTSCCSCQEGTVRLGIQSLNCSSVGHVTSDTHFANKLVSIDYSKIVFHIVWPSFFTVTDA